MDKTQLIWVVVSCIASGVVVGICIGANITKLEKNKRPVKLPDTLDEAIKFHMELSVKFKAGDFLMAAYNEQVSRWLIELRQLKESIQNPWFLGARLLGAVLGILVAKQEMNHDSEKAKNA